MLLREREREINILIVASNLFSNYDANSLVRRLVEARIHSLLIALPPRCLFEKLAYCDLSYQLFVVPRSCSICSCFGDIFQHASAAGGA
jgi:hypothetical protein